MQVISKFSAVGVSILGLLVLVSCQKAERSSMHQSSNSSSGNSEGEVVGIERFYLDADTLAQETDKALDGDPQAADRIYSHYAMFKPSDPTKVEFWMRVAAENGNAGYMMVYADHLHQQGGHVHCERAVYWLRRAISANPAVTADAERKIQEIRDNKECLRT